MKYCKNCKTMTSKKSPHPTSVMITIAMFWLLMGVLVSWRLSIGRWFIGIIFAVIYMAYHFMTKHCVMCGIRHNKQKSEEMH